MSPRSSLSREAAAEQHEAVPTKAKQDTKRMEGAVSHESTKDTKPERQVSMFRSAKRLMTQQRLLASDAALTPSECDCRMWVPDESYCSNGSLDYNMDEMRLLCYSEKIA